jgi:hypothetical protein
MKKITKLVANVGLTGMYIYTTLVVHEITRYFKTHGKWSILYELQPH